MGALSMNTGGGDPGLGANSAQSGASGFNPLSLAVPAGAGILNWLTGQDTNEANSAEAVKNRAFASDEAYKARLYDTEKTKWQATHGYQNAVDDMTKAGLNPALMYAGKAGAESGSGGGPMASAPGNPQHTNAMAPAIASASQGAQLLNDLKNSDAQRTLTGAQTLQSIAASRREASSAKLNEIEAGPAQSEAASRKNKASLDQIYDKGDRMLHQGGAAAGIFSSAAGGAADLVGAITGRGRMKNEREANQLKGLRGIRVR